jgi:hypothetical protein
MAKDVYIALHFRDSELVSYKKRNPTDDHNEAPERERPDPNTEAEDEEVADEEVGEEELEEQEVDAEVGDEESDAVDDDEVEVEAEDEAGDGVEDDVEGDVEDEDEDEHVLSIPTDSDTRHRPWPKYPNARAASTEEVEKYVRKLRDHWIKDNGDPAQIIDIPDGYIFVKQPRTDGKIDWRLYGHPHHRDFNSPNKFYPHLKYLIATTKNPNAQCECEVCPKPSKAP